MRERLLSVNGNYASGVAAIDHKFVLMRAGRITAPRLPR
jgi:hypothetical protein